MRQSNRAFLDGPLHISNAPVDPVFHLRAICISRGTSREDVVVVVKVHRQAQPNLLEPIYATRLASFGFGFGERGQQHRGQDRDYSNDDQQFDQGKCFD